MSPGEQMDQPSDGEGFDPIAARLCVVRWGSAPDWDDRAGPWLLSHYERLRGLGSSVDWYTRPDTCPGRGHLREEDAPRIAAAVASIRSAAEARGMAIEPTTRDLLPHILGWALAVEAGIIHADEDPGAPLMALFEAGFQVQLRHEGVHIHHQSGWRIYQPPRG